MLCYSFFPFKSEKTQRKWKEWIKGTGWNESCKSQVAIRNMQLFKLKNKTHSDLIVNILVFRFFLYHSMPMPVHVHVNSTLMLSYLYEFLELDANKSLYHEYLNSSSLKTSASLCKHSKCNRLLLLWLLVVANAHTHTAKNTFSYWSKKSNAFTSTLHFYDNK